MSDRFIFYLKKTQESHVTDTAQSNLHNPIVYNKATFLNEPKYNAKFFEITINEKKGKTSH